MKRHRRICVVLVSIAIGVSVMGCSSTPDPTLGDAIRAMLGKEAKRVISDPDRQQEALGGVDNMGDALDAFAESLSDARAEARALNADYDATREQFEEMYNRFDASRRGHMQRLMLAEIGLRDSVTSEEWTDLTAPLDSLPGIAQEEDGG